MRFVAMMVIMSECILLRLKSTEQARASFRRCALRYVARILREEGEHRAADKLINRAATMESIVPAAEEGFEVVP